VIVVKGWQLYGPSTEQVKSIAAAALEKAQTALNGTAQQTADSQAPSFDPRNVVAPPNEPPIATQGPPLSAAPLASAPQLVPLPDTAGNSSTVPGVVAPVQAAPSTTTTDDDAVTKLLAQLEELGAAGAQVAPWGSSGELYRCYCQAKLEETSLLARHFEAVAAEPSAAVEQVVAKVEAWRTEQQSRLR
jgi:hypothetical protein